MTVTLILSPVMVQTLKSTAFILTIAQQGPIGTFQTHLGTIVSSNIDGRQELIQSVTLEASFEFPPQTYIDFYMSNTGGQRWYQVNSGESFVFPTTGSDLRWKAKLHSLSPANTPVLKQVSITANSAPTDIDLSCFVLSENSGVGQEIGTFVATDVDADENHSFSIVEYCKIEGEEGTIPFVIEGNVLKSNYSGFNFESSQKTCEIRVKADDGEGGLFEKEFIIIITDANDAPTGIGLNNNTIARE